jgi:hypothetical protein
MSQQRAPINQAIAGNGRRISIALSRETAHGVAPGFAAGSFGIADECRILRR